MKIFYFSLLALALIALINYQEIMIPLNSSLTKEVNQQYPPFLEWRLKFGKNYASQAQLAYREAVYLKTAVEVKAHNILFQLGQTTYTKSLNAFADITPQEFAALFQNIIPTATNKCDGSIMDTPNPPAELDWVNKVNPPQTQSYCKRGWAMVAVNAVESLYAIKVGPLLPKLSTQQLVECSIDYGNQGCDGGFMDQAFWYIIDNGIAQQSSYKDRDPSKCKYVMNMKYTGISRCARIPSRSYSKLLSAIVQQPVSVVIDLNADFKDYSQGIYKGKCTSNINHAMLLIGYGGKQADQYFWRLKSSLGPDWGQKGYLKLKRVESDGDGSCGIQIWPSVPQNIV